MNSTMTMTAPTEQDRAVARRVLLNGELLSSNRRAHAMAVASLYYIPGRLPERCEETAYTMLAAAVDGARLGREYAAALRSAS